MAKEMASYPSTISENDKTALGTWARNAKLEDWKDDPIGRIKGVSLVTFQYFNPSGNFSTGVLSTQDFSSSGKSVVPAFITCFLSGCYIFS